MSSISANYSKELYSQLPSSQERDFECADTLIALALPKEERAPESSSSANIQKKIYGPTRKIQLLNNERKSSSLEPLFSRAAFKTPVAALHHLISQTIRGTSKEAMTAIMGTFSSSNSGTRARNERRFLGENIRSNPNSKTQRQMNAIADAILDNEERFRKFAPKSNQLPLKNGSTEERFLQFDNGKFTGPIQRLQQQLEGIGNKLSARNPLEVSQKRVQETQKITQAVIEKIGRASLLKALETSPKHWDNSQPGRWLSGSATPPNTVLRFLQFLREGFIEISQESEESSKRS